MTETNPTTYANAVPLHPNPWIVTATPDRTSYTVELPSRGVAFEIDADLRFQLLDALHDPEER
jgi:hypothetical protein